MPNVINTNIKSLVAQQASNVNERAMDTAMQRLSTGKRINGAADDAAGLAISNRMTAQIRGLDMGVRNANDGISMLQTVEGASTTITNMLQRMRELAVQSANGSYEGADRTAIQAEFTALSSEINHIASDTLWNGVSRGNSTDTVTFQIGSATGSTMTFTFQNLATVASAATAAGVTTTSASTTAISSIDTAIAAVDSYRGSLGATVNRLNYAADNLANVSNNASASRSRVLDTDYAQATTELARTQIIQQAATAMLAQANQSTQNVLTLLR